MVVCIDRSFSAPFQQFEILTYISVWLVDETSGECSFSEDLPAFNTFKSSARIEAGTSLWTKFEATYVERCKELGIMPSERFLRGLKEARCNQNACTRLNVTHGRVDDHHVQPLIEALREHHDIEEVALNFNDKLTDEGCQRILNHVLETPSIIAVELFGNSITDSSCNHFKRVLRQNVLVRLKIGDNHITASGACILAEGLVHNDSLQQLHLGGNQIEDAGLIALVHALQGNDSLTSLGLRDNAIGPVGMQRLALLLASPTCKLSELQIKGNAIGDDGASALADALGDNTSMRVLEVQSNMVGPVGCTALCKALHGNTFIYAINLNGNAIGDDGAAAMAELLSSVSRAALVPMWGFPIVGCAVCCVKRVCLQETER
jgi:Ran GTPase-activating protein (RanGAP) involved in mRNA processing and transport